MSAIFLPRRWRHQPQGAVEIDWRNPLTAGLVFCYSPNLRRNLATQVVSATPSQLTTTVAASPHGIGAQVTDGQIVRFNQAALPDRFFGTLFAVARLDSPNLQERTILSLSAGTTNPLFRLQTNSSRYIQFQTRGPKATNVIAPSVTEVGRFYSIAGMIYGANGEQSLYIDGKWAATDYVGLNTTFTKTTIGALHRSSIEQAWVGNIPYAAIWNAPMDLAALQSVFENPCQIFRASPNRIWFDLGAGAEPIVYALNAEAGSVGAAGAAGSPLAQRRIDAQAGGSAITGADASLGKIGSYALNAQPGALAVAGQATGLAARRRLSADASSIATTSVDAGLRVMRMLSADAGHIAVTGADAHLARAGVHTLSADAGQISIDGADAVFDAPSAGGHPLGVRVYRYSMRIGGRMVYADTPQALQAAIAEFEASIPVRAEKRAQKAGKVVVRRLPKVQVVEAPADERADVLATARAANDRIAAEYLAALQAQIAIRAAMEAAERDDMEAITVLELL
ncbi:MAG: hypothetical protein LT106_18605 [Burkholderiaceae bacterium]|nr:hypothetical protein [Burkholderiaceae bacterium]